MNDYALARQDMPQVVDYFQPDLDFGPIASHLPRQSP